MRNIHKEDSFLAVFFLLPGDILGGRRVLHYFIFDLMVKREPTRVRVGVRYGPAGLELPAGNKNSKMVSRLVGQYHTKDKLHY